MKNQNYKFLKDAPIFGDWYKKGNSISLNEKQARRFVDDGVLELDRPRKPSRPSESLKKEG